jgi:hypothetical protein
MDDSERVIELYWKALADNDLQRASTMLGDDFVEEWPQSGERIHGPDNWLAMATAHPTFPSIRPLETQGAGDLWVTQAHFDYPTDEGAAPFKVCAIQRVRDGKLVRLTQYFAAPFEAAEWRKEWVERMDGR